MRNDGNAPQRFYLVLLSIIAASAVVVYLIGPRIGQVPCETDPARLAPPTETAGAADANYLHTCGSRLYDARGQEVRITGINWFGAETETYAPHGLWARNYKAILDQIAALGYNTIRLPFSNEVLEPGRLPQGISYQHNPELQGLTSLEVIDRVVAAGRERGLKVVLDRHRPTSQGQTPLWYTEDVTEERWIEDWKMLAQRYFGDDTVIGFDLHNEPRGEATWGSGDIATDWRLAAERAGNAIHEVNPYLLIFVQGVDRVGNDYYWWGGNLIAVEQYPVRLTVSNRLIYAPHDYGPGVFLQGYFSDLGFPRNLPRIWDRYWGYIQRSRIAPVVVGEFGGRSVGDDLEGLWQRALLDYMQRNGIGFIAWTLNPNSSDTGGVLDEDWLTVVEQKRRLYSQYLAPPIERAQTPDGASNKVKIAYRTSKDGEDNNIAINVQIISDSATPINYSRIELRYWYSAGDLGGRAQQFEVDYAAMGEKHVKGKLVRANAGRQDHYLSITFGTNAGAIQPYTASGEIIMRVHKSDWSDYDQSDDFSRGSFIDFQEWDRIAAYVDGKRVWGNEP